jgi:hypothetical protein
VVLQEKDEKTVTRATRQMLQRLVNAIRVALIEREIRLLVSASQTRVSRKLSIKVDVDVEHYRRDWILDRTGFADVKLFHGFTASRSASNWRIMA